MANLKTIVCPGPEFHDTGLLVEGKVFDVDLARRLVNGWRLPLHQTVPPKGSLRSQGHLEIAIGAAMSSGY